MSCVRAVQVKNIKLVVESLSEQLKRERGNSVKASDGDFLSISGVRVSAVKRPKYHTGFITLIQHSLRAVGFTIEGHACSNFRAFRLNY